METLGAAGRVARSRLESMAAECKTIELVVPEWGLVLMALCGTGAKEMTVRKYQLRTATKIANQLAESLGIAPPSWRSR